MSVCKHGSWLRAGGFLNWTRKTGPKWVAAGMFLCFALGTAVAQEPGRADAAPDGAGGFVDPLAENPAKAPIEPPSIRFGLQGQPVEAFALDPVDEQEWGRIQAEDQQRALEDKVVRYGFLRPLGLNATAFGSWYEVFGVGHVWLLDVDVPDAMGVRLNLTDMDLPEGAEIFVYSPDLPQRAWGPYQGMGPFEAGEVWTPTTFGSRVRIEYFVPGTSTADAAGHGESHGYAFDLPPDLQQVSFQITACQHVYKDPLAEGAGLEGACHNDVTCYPAWATVARAAAGIGTINSDALFCSGTMITTTANDQTPYWLTANHCIGSNGTAQNSEIYWLFQTSTCNGTPPTLSSVPQSAVCTRLSYSSGSDYSLLMVEGVIPNGLGWAGWSSSTVANGTACTGIHHPDGAYKRISFGNKISGAATGFIRIDWTDAPTEPGSSGSGIFRNDTQQLVGQLYGGPSSCADESYDDYGAFATSYGNISSYLSAGSDDAYEQNDSCAAARAMTAGTYSNLVLKRYSAGDEDWYAVSVNSGQTLTLTLNFTHANGDIDLALYSACGGAIIASSTGSGNSETVTYTHTGGSAASYYARAYLYNDTRNTYSMTVSLSGGGGGGNNDTCANATAVVNGTYTGSTSTATNDGSASCGRSTTSKDVWFKYTAPRAGTLNVNTCNSSYDTVLSLHSACPGTSGNQLVCNDDCGGSPCGGTNSCLSRAVTAGTTYYIRVAGYRGASGSFTLTVAGP